MIRLALILLFFAAPACAGTPPNIATDIPAIHSLVASVMGDLGAPKSVMDPTASPHGYALRPSEAKTLSRADIIFWVGPAQSPSLARAIKNLAPKASSSSLIDAPGTHILPRRETAIFGEYDDHDAHSEHHDHDHGPIDPHAWLDPQNAIIWLDHIAETITKHDPENAAEYRENAARAKTDIRAAMGEIEIQLSGLNAKYIVLHDAFQYFETRFDLPAAAALSPSDATAPGPARVVALRQVIVDQNIVCIFSEPNTNIGIINVLRDGTSLKFATIDPIGVAISPGKTLYVALLKNMADTMKSCLN